jgi:GDP-L-fucose synthase
MCQSYRRQYGCNFIAVMPTNLYGPGDNFDLEASHVVPALIRKFHEARVQGAETVTLWGTGTPRREFLHVDDLADACVFLMQHYNAPEIINIGVGKDISIRELGELIQKLTGFQGEIQWDTSKPDGTPRKLLDISRLTQLGWQARISLEAGLRQTYRWFCEHLSGQDR